jgi:hypothetical protein
MTAGLPLLDPVAGHAAAGALGGVLLLGGAAKLRDLALFRAVLEDYRLLPAALIAPVALLLALAELAAGGLLLPVPLRVLGAGLALLVLAVVSAAVTINLLRGRRQIACGCGGDAPLPLGAGLLWRNAALALLGLAAAAPVLPRATVWLDPLAAGFAALFLLGLVAVANQLLSHHPRLTALRDTP